MAYNPQKDHVFCAAHRGDRPLVFDDAVAEAFDDMAARSIPGYAQSLRTIVWLARTHVLPVFPRGSIYDLGASTGALEEALLEIEGSSGWELVAIDGSAHMLERAEARLGGQPGADRIRWKQQDAAAADFEDAILVVAHYCLQFVAPEQRAGILRRVFDGLHPGGFVVMSEKTRAEPAESAYYQSRYDAFKRDQGYTHEEIENKRRALEGVLIPWTSARNEQLIVDAGFHPPITVMKHWNFVTWIARKPANIG